MPTRAIGRTEICNGVSARNALRDESTDPDTPTALSESTINGVNSSNMSEDNTYYYIFNVNKGTLTWTLDLTPTNKSDAGGVLQWTLLSPKFEKLKYDNLSAQGSLERQVKDMPVTIKRRIILKIVCRATSATKSNCPVQLSNSAVQDSRSAPRTGAS